MPRDGDLSRWWINDVYSFGWPTPLHCVLVSLSAFLYPNACLLSPKEREISDDITTLRLSAPASNHYDHRTENTPTGCFHSALTVMFKKFFQNASKSLLMGEIIQMIYGRWAWCTSLANWSHFFASQKFFLTLIKNLKLIIFIIIFIRLSSDTFCKCFPLC